MTSLEYEEIEQLIINIRKDMKQEIFSLKDAQKILLDYLIKEKNRLDDLRSE